MSSVSQFIPNDPNFSDQWEFLNTGQTGGVSGNDVGITWVWPDYSGVGITVAIVDAGVQQVHPDLSANADTSLNYDFIAGSSTLTASGNHATFIAGQISGSTNNGLDTAGVAWSSTCGSFRTLGGSDDVETGAVETQDGDTDPLVYEKLESFGFHTSNHSYGPQFPFIQIFSDEEHLAAASFFQNARDGLGGIAVYASGNERLESGTAQSADITNLPFEIQVGAWDHYGAYGSSGSGISSAFSNPGANLLISAPGVNVTSTDQTSPNGYNSEGEVATSSGTSFAAPIVTGVTAVMLEANAGLGARDVQQILAYSAEAPTTAASTFNPNAATGDSAFLDDTVSKLAAVSNLTEDKIRGVLETPWDWQINGADNWNGGGLHVSHDYGFGHVDARGAVRLAESWDVDVFGAQINTSWNSLAATSGGSVSVADGGSVTSTISVADSAIVQRLQATVDFESLDSEAIEISLTSPEGTTSYLWQNYDFDVMTAFNSSAGSIGAEELREAAEGGFLFIAGGAGGATTEAVLSSTQHWGENITGDWILTITDTVSDGKGYTLDNWTLNFYNEESSTNDRYVYSDEFSDVVTAARQTLTDSDGGTDQLNASQVTTASTINLAGSSTSTIDGVSLTIASDTVIERAHGGDGNDTISGNSADNALFGWRGDDQLAGGTGNDTINGGTGTDSATWATSRSDASIAWGSDGGTVTTSGLGTDSVSDVETYSFSDRSVNPVFRFLGQDGSHIFSADATEIASLTSDAGYTLEGVAMAGVAAGDGDTALVWRLRNDETGSILMTADETEKDNLAGQGYTVEGASFTAFTTETTDSSAVYRLYDASLSRHFFTASEIEKDAQVNAGMALEGIAFYSDGFF